MEESGETVGVIPLLQTKAHGFTIDLVRNLAGENNSPAKNLEAKELEHKGNGRLEEEGEIELSLGLSLNGNFGLDPKRTQVQLCRASSMSAFTLKGDENQMHEAQFGMDASSLIRTCSLPNVMDEELKKRKALQSFRRVEAKKRRMDKVSISKEGKEKVVDNLYNQNCSVQGFVCNNNGDGTMPLLLVHGPEPGSQGSSSSSISELESNSIQDSLTNEAKAPNGNHCQLPETDRNLTCQLPETDRNLTCQLPETDRNPTFKRGPTNNIRSRQCRTMSDHKPPIAPRTMTMTMSSRDKTSIEEEEAKKKKMEDLRKKMPLVTTIGKGQNGKKIEGLLYRYKKGEEVMIMCVCHGSMFSPAQFVRHAGGLDVDYPLRHIVVTSPPCL